MKAKSAGNGSAKGGVRRRRGILTIRCCKPGFIRQKSATVL